MIASAYHEDADENHGAFKGTGRQFAEHLVPLMDAAPDTSGHHVTNILIERKGNSANVESYFMAFHEQNEGGRAFVTGRYLDHFTCRDGDWKIAHRRVVIDSDSPAMESMKLADYPRGKRREAIPRMVGSIDRRVAVPRLRTLLRDLRTEVDAPAGIGASA